LIKYVCEIIQELNNNLFLEKEIVWSNDTNDLWIENLAPQILNWVLEQMLIVYANNYSEIMLITLW